MATIRRDSGAGHHFLYDSAIIDEPSIDTFTQEHWEVQHKIIGRAKGRGTTLFIEHEQHSWVLRHFQRGGLIGKLLSDQYLFLGVESSRPFKEFRLLAEMRREGLNVPVPVTARIHRRGMVYRGDLITEEIRGSQDLHKVLCCEPLKPEQWQAVGHALAAMHNHQVYHHDANIRNIMIDDKQTIWLIDFDRCRKREGQHWKAGNLDRLLRSLLKEKEQNAIFHWSMDEWQHCLNGYSSIARTA
ncbi:3-deoxy-D-manno-octulosonic acid kinase [Alteromonas sp. A081]|uniref:3-deoxy-D-manno-octulosonic acid kinase n=1 Tax=Alteromonas sp. A081 TaxID=3410269 RepID=UPI003B987E00